MQLPLIDLLCDHGADANSAIHDAVLHGEMEAVDALIRRGARIDLAVAAALERVDDISGGIFYTGIRELSIGLEVGWRAFEIRPPLDSSGVLAQLGVQYYW